MDVFGENSYKLSELLEEVKESLVRDFPDAVWVEAEISGLSGEGEEDSHCYLELLELDDFGNKIAAVKAHIWRSLNFRLANKFLSVTGRVFANGDKVRFKVKVDFSEKYGFSLNIVDIDPNFTLGDLAARKAKTWQRLVKEQLTELNKELSVPALPFRIAIVSAEGAAGYGDFINQLHLAQEQLDCKFSIQLFEAMMQGDLAPQSIYDAFGQIAQIDKRFDVVVFIRGGGSNLDLACFDEYLVCRAIAECKYPVISGIGHERDNHLCDDVSAVRVKTPTAAAAFLIDCISEQKEKISTLEKGFFWNIRQKIHESQLELQQYVTQLSNSVNAKLNQKNLALSNIKTQISNQFIRKFAVQEPNLEHVYERILANYSKKIEFAEIWIYSHKEYFRNVFYDKWNKNDKALLLMEQRINASNPVRILKRGYALIDADGKKVININQIAEGSHLRVQMQDGVVEFVVSEIKSKSSHIQEN